MAELQVWHFASNDGSAVTVPAEQQGSFSSGEIALVGDAAQRWEDGGKTGSNALVSGLPTGLLQPSAQRGRGLGCLAVQQRR